MTCQLIAEDVDRIPLERANTMKRKSPLKYDDAFGCVLLWSAVIKPDGRTAMKWLRAALRERSRKTRLV